VQIALNYSLFAGGFGFHQGAEQIGACVIPASLTTSPEKQAIIMRDFKVTALISTPSHGVNLIAALDQLQIHPERLHLRTGLFGGERLSDPLRRLLEERLHITSVDTYGLTEIMGSGVAGECSQRNGFHINEDHFIVEVVNPQTLEPVEAGGEGELVLTTIQKEGFPLIRYRTGDITSLNREPCPCGRTFVRMAWITGRTDDLILFQGVGFFPSQIEEILSGVKGASPHYQIILDKQGDVDTLEIRVEILDTIPFLDEVKALEALRVQMAGRIKTALDINAKVTFVEPKSLSRLAGAGRRVMDRRSR
jgi:phenylacetate-CoA ligase